MFYNIFYMTYRYMTPNQKSEKMTESIKDRLQFIIDTYFNGNASLFYRDVEMKQSTMNEYFGKNERMPSSKTISKLINGKTVKINATWLLTGEGNHRDDQISESIPDQDQNKIRMEIELKLLREENEKLKNRLEEVNSEYAVLKYRYKLKDED